MEIKNQKCEDIMNRYLALDKNQRVPLKISRHLLTCECCRRKIELIASAEKKAAAPLSVKASENDSTIQAVMQQINKLELEKIRKRQLPFSGWIIFGVIMTLLLVVATYLIKKINSQLITSSYALLIAGSLIAYTLVFVYSNMDVFVKQISTVIKGLQPNS